MKLLNLVTLLIAGLALSSIFACDEVQPPTSTELELPVFNINDPETWDCGDWPMQAHGVPYTVSSHYQPALGYEAADQLSLRASAVDPDSSKPNNGQSLVIGFLGEHLASGSQPIQPISAFEWEGARFTGQPTLPGVFVTDARLENELGTVYYKLVEGSDANDYFGSFARPQDSLSPISVTLQFELEVDTIVGNPGLQAISTFPERFVVTSEFISCASPYE